MDIVAPVLHSILNLVASVAPFALILALVVGLFVALWAVWGKWGPGGDD